MKGFKRSSLMVLALLLIISITAACGAKQASPSESMDSSLGLATEEDMAYEERGDSPLEPEKVITTIYIDLETRGFDETDQALRDNIKKHGAYVENSNVNYSSGSKGKRYKSAYYLVRVPKDQVAEFTKDLGQAGTIVSESTNKEDVTRQYRDTESRLRIIETKEARILALLEKAEKIDDIIKLEDELNKTIYEKENLQISLIHLDDKVDFTTFELRIREVERLSSGEDMDSGFLTRVKNAFANSTYVFTRAMEKFLLGLIYLLPFLVVAGIIAYPLARFMKKRKTNNKK